MADNLKITTPIQTNETVHKVRPKEQSDQIQQIDPSRVTSKNNQQDTEQGKQGGLEFQFRQQSVYNQFLKQLQESSGLTHTLKKILFDAFLTQGVTAPETKLDVMLEQFSKLAEMDSPEAITFQIKYMIENKTKFHDDLFDLIRTIASQVKISHPEDEVEFNRLLGKFLKTYDNFFSTKTTLSAIKNILKNMLPYMRRTYSENLQLKIDVLTSENSLPKQTAFLTNDILPFLNKYVSEIKDYGALRDMITLLVHNLSRLNQGTQENLETNFLSFLDHCRYNLNIDAKLLNQTKTMFDLKVSSRNETEDQNPYFQSMIEIIKNGIKDSTSTISRAMYEDISHSLLMDQSTFMPLTHIFLPIQYQGAFMFSEIWIDQRHDQDDNQQKSKNQEQKNNHLRIFLTFDIQNVGYFEAVIHLNSDLLTMTISYPEYLKINKKTVKDEIEEILHTKGFETVKLTVNPGSMTQSLDQVFPNLYERKTNINVSI